MNSIYPTLSFILLLGLHATPSFSQNDNFVKQFQQSRQAMLDDYNKFRNTILTDYDKYMQGIWKEYKKFKGDVRSQVPKPKTPPTYTAPKQPEKPVTVKPKIPVSPAEPETPKKPDPKAPTVRPKIEPVKKPKLPEVKPDIPDIEYTGSGIELPLMPAVAFHEPVENGTSYEYKGKKFYICDPTYIGAKIGKCMPSYAKESPQIEVWY